MDWKRIVDAADGRPQSLAWIVDQPSADVAALATLLLLEEAPHPAAALVAAAAWRGNSAPPIQAALAPHVAPALAAWRADPHWAERAIGDRARLELPWGVAVMSGALRDRPAAQHDAVAVVLRCGDSDAVVRCLAALGADGWRALGDDLRAALLAQAPAPALGRVWDALDEARRAAAAQRAAATPGDAARLIGSIGAAAWDATDRALRRRLIDAAVRDPVMMVHTARAWAGMTDDEHERLIAAATAHAKAWNALDLLSALGAAGRATLAAKQRAALDALALEHPDAWRVLAWRAADAGWRALTGDARAAVLAAAQRDGRNVPLLLRAIDGAGWRAMDDRERGRLAAVVHRAPDALFSCPPTLWRDLVGADLPRATEIPQVAIAHWRPEDAAADLGALPPTHQAVVLALAPWRTEDAASDSARMQRLRAAWNALTADARVALATTHPLVLAPVAAAWDGNGRRGRRPPPRRLRGARAASSCRRRARRHRRMPWIGASSSMQRLDGRRRSTTSPGAQPTMTMRR